MGNNDRIYLQKESVHKILAHSYSMHFIFFLIGFFLDMIYKFRVFANFTMAWVGSGVVLLILGSILIFWAQYTSHHLNKKNITKETFGHGPYHYTRTPTNFGIFFMMLGFGIIAISFFIIFFAFISFIAAKFVFLNKEEKVLAAKYGAPFLEYKKIVKF